jgi:uncharacterized membrane protein YoaK (UPF0700 family)
MVHVELKDVYRKEYTLLWVLLSFKAGLLNACGFLIAGSYVSHITGFGTQVGLALGHNDYTFGAELLVIPVAFIGGALFTSLVLDTNYSKEKIPHYPVVQLSITALIGLVSAGFATGFFKPDVIVGRSESSIILVGLLCFICGIKNALTTWASHGKIRTTHITGLSTDIGLHLPKIFRAPGASSRYPESRAVTYVRISTLVSFSAGSCIAAMLVPAVSYGVFYVAFVISAALSLISIVHRRQTILKTKNFQSGEKYANAH